MTLFGTFEASASASGTLVAERPRQLVVVCGDTPPRVLVLDPDRVVTVGADPSNDVVIDEPQVCAHHCALAPSHGAHRLIGIETHHHLLLNGRRVREALLAEFDRVSLGDCTLVYLPGSVDGERVKALLAHPDASTQQAGAEPGLDRVREKLLWLLFMTQALPPGAPLSPALELLLKETLRWTGYDAGALLIRRADGRLELRHDTGRHLSEAELTRITPLLRDVIEAGGPYFGNDPRLPGRAIVCVPVSNASSYPRERRLSAVARVEGALLLIGATARHPEQLDTTSASLLQALARQVAILLGNARLHRQATTDPLTGLATRGCTEQVLADELRRTNARAAVLLIDIDDFKRVNDEHGDAVGDQTLKRFGARLAPELRGDDFAGRWGGEEFLVILPATDQVGAEVVAEKVLAAASRTAGVLPRITVSIGVAVSPAHGADPEALLAAADEALCAAKRAGKGRYAVAPERPPDAPRPAPPPASTAPPPPAPPPTTGFALRAPWLGAVPLMPGLTSVGRSGCDVTLYHPTVSRRHGVLIVDPGQGAVLVRDTSTNGTTLNGERIHPDVSVALEAGDELGVGPFTLRLERLGSLDPPT